MKSFDIIIYGTHQRDELIANLKAKLEVSDENIVYDDRPNGGKALYTFEKAWRHTLPNDITHRICIPDDIDVCDNFKEIAKRMIKAHPNKIILLFPFWLECYNKVELDFKKFKTPYLSHRHAICGCGIIMPVSFIQPCFDWIDEQHRLDYDDVIEEDCVYDWAKKNKIDIITTMPSTVQHLGDNSILTPNVCIRRTKQFCQVMPDNINWDSTEVIDCPGFVYDPIGEWLKRIKEGKSEDPIKKYKQLMKEKEKLNGTYKSKN